ncbi:MAG TPA: hypothetical protein PLL69_05825 [Gemmatimonadales bacterium]|nr:hypothetical protein [Gemmatimonadales bacterium]
MGRPVEDILAIIFIFGGGTSVLLSFSPVGKAIAERIRYGRQALPVPDPDPALYEEVDRMRLELNEIHERLDFTERLLAEKKDTPLPLSEERA